MARSRPIWVSFTGEIRIRFSTIGLKYTPTNFILPISTSLPYCGKTLPTCRQYDRSSSIASCHLPKLRPSTFAPVNPLAFDLMESYLFACKSLNQGFDIFVIHGECFGAATHKCRNLSTVQPVMFWGEFTPNFCFRFLWDCKSFALPQLCIFWDGLRSWFSVVRTTEICMTSLVSQTWIAIYPFWVKILRHPNWALF